MMRCPEDVVIAVTDLDYADPHERRRLQIKTALGIGPLIILQPGVQQRCGYVAPVEMLKREGRLLANYLYCLLPAFPIEPGPQHRMNGDDALPGALQCQNIQPTAQRAQKLQAIDAGLWRHEAAKQHHFLHWREAIQILESTRRDNQVQRLLVDAR